jgi:hypothetical protein
MNDELNDERRTMNIKTLMLFSCLPFIVPRSAFRVPRLETFRNPQSLWLSTASLENIVQLLLVFPRNLFIGRRRRLIPSRRYRLGRRRSRLWPYNGAPSGHFTPKYTNPTHFFLQEKECPDKGNEHKAAKHKQDFGNQPAARLSFRHGFLLLSRHRVRTHRNEGTPPCGQPPTHSAGATHQHRCTT